jgi:hypothetical protein
MMRDLFSERRNVEAALVRSAPPRTMPQGRAEDVELLRPPSRSAGPLVVQRLPPLWQAA